jgi:hypothetical protein
MFFEALERNMQTNDTWIFGFEVCLRWNFSFVRGVGFIIGCFCFERCWRGLEDLMREWDRFNNFLLFIRLEFSKHFWNISDFREALKEAPNKVKKILGKAL